MAWVIESLPEKKEAGGGWAIEPAQKDEPISFDVAKAAKNLPGSMYGVAKDTAQALMSPIESAKAVGKTLAGAINLAYPGDLIRYTDTGKPVGEEEARAVGEMYREQYGSLPKILKTFEEDPAVPILDLATLITGGGVAAAKAPGMVGKVGRAAAAPMRAVEALPGKAIGGLAQKLYGSAVKFPEAAGFEGRRRAIEAGRKAGITIDEPGIAKLQSKIKGLGKDLDSVLEKAEAAGAKADVIELWDKVDEVRATSELTAAPIDLDRAVDRVVNQHLAAMEIKGKDFYTPKELNTLKRALSERVKYSSAPGSVTSPDRALIESKAASVARETLEGMDPRISEINKQMGPLMALRDPAYSAAFKGKVMSEHPIIAGSIGRTVGGTPAGILAQIVGPRKLAGAGIQATKLAESPLLRALSGPVPMGAYSTTRLGGK